jgi:hypothetical protein
VAVKKLVDLAEESAKDTARFITEDVRDLAVKHGWESESVEGVSVNYDNSAFSFEIAPEVEHSVMNLEYGTETTAPTAVFRKYGSNTKEAERVFIRGLEKRVGVSL